MNFEFISKSNSLPTFARPQEAVDLAEKISDYVPDNEMWERVLDIYQDPRYSIQKSRTKHNYIGLIAEVLYQLIIRECTEGTNHQYNPFLDRLTNKYSKHNGLLLSIHNYQTIAGAVLSSGSLKTCGDLDGFALLNAQDPLDPTNRSTPMQFEIKICNVHTFSHFMYTKRPPFHVYNRFPDKRALCNVEFNNITNITYALTELAAISDAIIIPQGYKDPRKGCSIDQIYNDYEQAGGIIIPMYTDKETLATDISTRMGKRGLL